MHRLCRLLCLLFILATLFTSASAQITLQGTVTDNGDEPVYNALIKVTDQNDTTRVFSGTTDEQGWFSIAIVETGIDDPAVLPGSFRLRQNYPNPFNPVTVIGFEIAGPSIITLEIYNVLGQKVKTLLQDYQTNSSGQVVWDATNDFGQGVPAGVYIYTLRNKQEVLHKKMVLLDGKTGTPTLMSMSQTGTEHVSIGKTSTSLSEVLTLQVSGDNIEMYEISNFTIAADTTLNLSVKATVTDVDGNTYRTVKIGTQLWTTKNFSATHFRNGDSIPLVSGDETWPLLTSTAYCFYALDTNNIDTYGQLYNWYTIQDVRELAPEGWHIHTDAEWQQLEMHLGMSETTAQTNGWRGMSQGGMLKAVGTDYWNTPNLGATDEVGFHALPGGERSPVSGSCDGLGQIAYFWTATQVGDTASWVRMISASDTTIGRSLMELSAGCSVRLVRDVIPTAMMIGLQITPDGVVIEQGDSLQFSCQAVYDDGTKKYADPIVTWEISPDSAGSINSMGLFHANPIDTGDVVITAIYNNLSASVTVNRTFSSQTTVTDIDGNVYNIVKIGDQWWTAENLRVTRFNDGVTIPHISNFDEWSTVGDEAYCLYNDDENSFDLYGLLYNWWAVEDMNRIAPDGWHVPTLDDWRILEMALGMSEADAYNNSSADRGSNEGGQLKGTGTNHWNEPNTGATDQWGFNALGAGTIKLEYYVWKYLWQYTATRFMSSTEVNNNMLHTRVLRNYSAHLQSDYAMKNWGGSVRLVKDKYPVNALVGLNVSPGNVIIEDESEQRFIVYADYPDGSSRPVYQNVTWTISPTEAGTISSTGLFIPNLGFEGAITVTVNAYGNTATISASVENFVDSLTDYDGNVYKTIKVNGRWWMAENLRVTHFRDGSALTELGSYSDWPNRYEEAYCSYANDISSVETDGRLYNWYSTVDSRGIGPEGWRVPTDIEWQQLEMFLGMTQGDAESTGLRGDNEGGKLKQTGYLNWKTWNYRATDEIGFNAIGIGYRDYNAEYHGETKYARFWTSTSPYDNHAWGRSLSWENAKVEREAYQTRSGFNIRLIKEN